MHGGWKSSTIAEGYIYDSMNHKDDIHKKITKSIILKPTKVVMVERNVFQSKNQAVSTSEERITVDLPEKSATTLLKKSRADSVNREKDDHEIYCDDVFRYPTDT